MASARWAWGHLPALARAPCERAMGVRPAWVRPAIVPHAWPARAPLRSLQTAARPRRRGSFPPEFVLYGIFGVNAAVYAAWWYARDEAQRNGDHTLYRFMMRNFTSGEPNLREGRWWTLLTACVSHQELPHFAFNMLTFAFTAPALLPIVGAPQMLTLYVGAGLASTLIGIVWPYVVDPILHGERKSLGRKRHGVSQGASGTSFG